MSLIGIVIIITAFLALYWVFIGQRKYNEMFMPKKKQKLKAVLFDLDGVILDSFEAWFEVFNHVRRNLKLKQISKEEFRKKIWGGSVSEDVKNYFKNKDVKELEEMYKKLISKYTHKIKLLPNAKNILGKIKKKKIKIGLVTNTFKKPVLDTIKFHKLTNYFDAIVTADDVEKAKPSPEAIIKLCKKLNIMPQEAVLVGDTKNDFKAGRAAGVFVVGLNTHGDLIISKLSDLMELI